MTLGFISILKTTMKLHLVNAPELDGLVAKATRVVKLLPYFLMINGFKMLLVIAPYELAQLSLLDNQKIIPEEFGYYKSSREPFVLLVFGRLACELMALVTIRCQGVEPAEAVKTIWRNLVTVIPPPGLSEQASKTFMRLHMAALVGLSIIVSSPGYGLHQEASWGLFVLSILVLGVAEVYHCCVPHLLFFEDDTEGKEDGSEEAIPMQNLGQDTEPQKEENNQEEEENEPEEGEASKPKKDQGETVPEGEIGPTLFNMLAELAN